MVAPRVVNQRVQNHGYHHHGKEEAQEEPQCFPAVEHYRIGETAGKRNRQKNGVHKKHGTENHRRKIDEIDTGM